MSLFRDESKLCQGFLKLVNDRYTYTWFKRTENNKHHMPHTFSTIQHHMPHTFSRIMMKKSGAWPATCASFVPLG